VSARLAGRARIVLLAAEGLSNAEIARRTGTSRPTVLDWRARYDAGGILALDDLPRSGRLPEIDEIDVVVATIADEGRPPAHLGVTHWSARLLAAELKISFATVARIWRKWDRSWLNMVEILRDHHPPSHPPRHFWLRPRPDPGHHGLHKRKTPGGRLHSPARPARTP